MWVYGGDSDRVSMLCWLLSPGVTGAISVLLDFHLLGSDFVKGDVWDVILEFRSSGRFGFISVVPLGWFVMKLRGSKTRPVPISRVTSTCWSLGNMLLIV